MPKYKVPNSYAEPIFCPECKSRGTFQRDKKRDISVENMEGIVRLGWKGFTCQACGHGTVIPIEGLAGGL